LFGKRVRLVLTSADGAGKKQIVLTEAERQQKLQDEQVREA
jgi:hypothetical protein